MSDKIKFPIYQFTADGYFNRLYAYDRETRLYLLKEDSRLVKLVALEDLQKIVDMLQNKNN